MRMPRMAPLLLLLMGCQTPHKPHWEVTLNVNVETKPDPLTKVSGGITAKRVVMSDAKK